MSCRTPSPPASPCAATTIELVGRSARGAVAHGAVLRYHQAGRGRRRADARVRAPRHRPLAHGRSSAPQALREDILLTYRGRAIRPKTAGQKRYVDAIREHTITFGIGPAGTGQDLPRHGHGRCRAQAQGGRPHHPRPAPWWRPARASGFLPGTPHREGRSLHPPALRRPVRHDRHGDARTQLIESGVIEIAPLAFMRGRTLNDSFIILDEAQNTTPEQMKMFLTRLGFGSKMVVTGDVTQLDLPRGVSGLKGVRGDPRGHRRYRVLRFHRQGRGAPFARGRHRVGLRPRQAERHEVTMDVQIDYRLPQGRPRERCRSHEPGPVRARRARTSPFNTEVSHQLRHRRGDRRAQRARTATRRARPTCCPSSATALDDDLSAMTLARGPRLRARRRGHRPRRGQPPDARVRHHVRGGDQLAARRTACSTCAATTASKTTRPRSWRTREAEILEPVGRRWARGVADAMCAATPSACAAEH